MSGLVVCPYCQYVHENDWVKKEGKAYGRCESCTKPFIVTVSVSIDYTTEPLPAQKADQ